MKRFFVLMLFLVVMSTAAFALDNNFGFGALYNNATTYGHTKDQWWEDHYFNSDWFVQRNGFGAFIFLGLNRFFELNLGLLYKDPYNMREEYDDGDEPWEGDPENWSSVFAVQAGLYFKFPVTISDKFTIFPTIGVDGELSLYSLERGTFLPEGWWHDIWFRGGVGLDFFFTDTVFLRTHLIYGVGLPIGGLEDDNLTLSHGLLVKLGIGWMF